MKRLKRTRRFIYFSLALMLCLFGILWVSSLAVVAQDDLPGYVGVSDCNDCHRDAYNTFKYSHHNRTMFEYDDDDFTSFILADFNTLPEDASAENIALVIGAGREAQQYVLNTDEGYALLPYTWDSRTQSWRDTPHHLEYEADTPFATCTSCHATGVDEDTGEWVDAGASCESCHGPGEAHVDAADDAGRNIEDEEMIAIREAFVAEPNAACTSCHTDLTESYARRFVENQRNSVDERLAVIRAELGDEEPPEIIAVALELLTEDPASGIHNIASAETNLNLIERELDLLVVPVSADAPHTVSNPDECLECHAEEHANWSASVHANASLQPEFQRAYADQGRPTYCLRCHASGHDLETQGETFEGVICSSCHTIEEGAEHPPAPYTVAKDESVCANCHSGGHASVYEEWLTSDHADANVDCVDCHTAHTNSLILNEVNTTCGDCHAEAMNDEVHMGEDLICTDCHMTPRTTVSNPTLVSQTGHGMHVDPGVCADCHGLTHTLTASTGDDEADQEIQLLSNEVERLEVAASDNLTSGLMGGAVGVILLIGLIYLVLRLGRLT